MKFSTRILKKVAAVGALSVLASAAVVTPSEASIGKVSKGDLSGAWQMTLVGNTGCGLTAYLVNFTLDGNGLATDATITTHAQCGDNVLSGQTFQVQSMSSNGSGSANLSCGPSCGFQLRIQVSPDRGMFNVVDVAPENPGNYLAGTAVHQ